MATGASGSLLMKAAAEARRRNVWQDDSDDEFVPPAQPPRKAVSSFKGESAPQEFYMPEGLRIAARNRESTRQGRGSRLGDDGPSKCDDSSGTKKSNEGNLRRRRVLLAKMQAAEASERAKLAAKAAPAEEVASGSLYEDSAALSEKDAAQEVSPVSRSTLEEASPELSEDPDANEEHTILPATTWAPAATDTTAETSQDSENGSLTRSGNPSDLPGDEGAWSAQANLDEDVNNALGLKESKESFGDALRSDRHQEETLEALASLADKRMELLRLHSLLDLYEAMKKEHLRILEATTSMKNAEKEMRARQQQLENERKALMELYNTCGPIRWASVERTESDDTDVSSITSRSPPPPLRRSRRVRRLKIAFKNEDELGAPAASLQT